ncbi:MAG: hypothetical protein IID37_00355 [Planctomycetes bacterium]|nr:hypothetical protein [Planctomycetota bacterium]
MNHSSRSLDNPINWSFPIGRLFGIAIRLHLFFVFGALWIIFQSVPSADSGMPLYRGLLYGGGTAAMLFAIVLLHEFGHCFGARYVGGTADEILLWPLGGLASVAPPHTPSANLVTVVAGPMVNVLFCAVSSFALVLWVGAAGAVPWNPFHPFSPVSAAVAFSEGQRWLLYFFGLNYLLLLFNLMPVYPFDGGRIFQCLLWPRKGYRDATMIASGVGMVGAIVLGLIGLLGGQYLLLGVAVFGYMTCYQQRQMLKMGAFELDSEFGYDFSQGYQSLERSSERTPRPSYWARRRAAKALARERRERERIEALQQRVDAILVKVHDHGLDSLTPQERGILEEASQRQQTGDQPRT